ncbi:MAG TPA: DUF1343 domain-containing protein, partial [bacterium]|nr:DUF1343 domain-containing protein [bacterium]
PKYYAGLICNQASVTSDLKYTHIELSKLLNIKYLFSPQHGFYSTEQANMIESPDCKDELTGLPVVSLYSNTRKINAKYLKKIDVLIFDLQDVGARYYTYLWTLYYCMEACEKHNKKLIILDRPNIITGNIIEGYTIENDYTSFVGLYPILMRYGLTIGEFAKFLKMTKFKNIDLEIYKLTNWSRNKYFDDYSNHWIPASPNIPTIDSAVVYPGFCLFEGTNISEGRGTTRPFEIIGAPFVNPKKLVDELNLYKFNSVYFRTIYFKPTFDKFKNEICGGVFLHIIDRRNFKPCRVAIALLYALKKLYPNQFDWFQGKYEYCKKHLAIDILYGSTKLRKIIDNGGDINIIFDEMAEAEKKWSEIFQKWWLY